MQSFIVLASLVSELAEVKMTPLSLTLQKHLSPLRVKLNLILFCKIPDNVMLRGKGKRNPFHLLFSNL